MLFQIRRRCFTMGKFCNISANPEIGAGNVANVSFKLKSLTGPLRGAVFRTALLQNYVAEVRT
jgi:hypothetical protein